MASSTAKSFRVTTLTVPAGSKLATYSGLSYSVDYVAAFSNEPPATLNSFSGSGANTTAAFSNDTVVTITAGDAAVMYAVGVAPVVYDRVGYQPTPGTLNATGTLTAALITGGIVTSTTAAAVAATLETGATLDAATAMSIGDSFDWSAINTGGNTFTVTASTGHTIVGVAAVVTVTSGQFRTLKTAAATFVTYRIS
jgi:hypothetical protein